MKRLFFIFLLLALQFPALADPQVQANQRAEAEFHLVEQEMTALYSDFYSRLTGVQKERFKNAQDAWLKYREAEVYARVTPHIGGLQAIEVDYITRIELTKVRIRILRQWTEQFSF